MTYTQNQPGGLSGIVMRVFVCLIGAALAAGAAAQARPGGAEREPTVEEIEAHLTKGLQVQKGPAQGVLGAVAGIAVPASHTFLPGGDAATYVQRLGNLRNDDILGVLRPPGGTDWFIVFMYEDCGYVKDDEKNSIDADAILASLREGNAAGNQERKRQGLAEMVLDGWQVKPHYNPQTHNLEWCTRLVSQGEVSLNYRVKILGRGGVMEAVLVCGPDEFSSALPAAQKLLAGHAFVAGQKYDEWRPGDKIATYGLTALITGGAAAVALKTGVLQKLIKPIIAGVVIIGAVIAKFFKRLFGRSE